MVFMTREQAFLRTNRQVSSTRNFRPPNPKSASKPTLRRASKRKAPTRKKEAKTIVGQDDIIGEGTVTLGNVKGLRGKRSIFRQEEQREERAGRTGWLEKPGPEWRAPNKHSGSKDNNEDKQSDIAVITSSPPPTATPTASQTNAPTFPALTMNAEKLDACKAAANGEVYKTQTSITIRFLYELLYPDDRDARQVASKVDKRIQTFLLDELVDCTHHRSPVGGVGPGKAFVDPILKDSCSNLVADESEVCHLMAGSVVLYLLSSGESNSEEELFDPVSEVLRLAFNGQRRFLQTRFVDENEGILGVYYVGDYVYHDTPSDPPSGAGELPVSSNIVPEPNYASPVSRSSSATIPIVVAASLLVASFILVFVVISVKKRVKESRENRAVLLDDKGDNTEWLKEERSDASKYSLRFSVVDTCDESDSSYCSTSSVDSAIAANERALKDLTGLIIDESVSSSSAYSSRPVFVDPNAVTYYSRSKTRLSFERSYSVSDTVEI